MQKKRKESIAKFYKTAHLVSALTTVKHHASKQLESQSSLSEIGGTILTENHGISPKIEEEKSEHETKTPITIFKQPSPTEPFSLVGQSQITKSSLHDNKLLNQSSIKSFHSSSNPHLTNNQQHPHNLPFQLSQRKLSSNTFSPQGKLDKKMSTRFSSRGFNGDGFECHADGDLSMEDEGDSHSSFLEKLSPLKFFQNHAKIIPLFAHDDRADNENNMISDNHPNTNHPFDIESQQQQHYPSQQHNPFHNGTQPLETHSPLHKEGNIAFPFPLPPSINNNISNNKNNLHIDATNVNTSGPSGPSSLRKGNSWQKAKQLLRKLSSEEIESERKKVKSKMKTNFRRQKFLDIFLFQNPELYYLMLQCLIASNAFYLALWTTNFAIVANRGHNYRLTAAEIILSILPALFSLPFIAQAIKSSSILKAVTKLNLDVVATVVEKTDVKIQLVATFRQNLRRYLTEINDGQTIAKTAINQLYEEYNTIDKSEGLTFKEFRDLLDGCGIHITKHKSRIIYNEMDINRDGSVNMEEFERFLFPEETRLNDQKKRKFFDAQNSKLLGEMNKKAAAKRILAFLDPHLISKM